MKLGDTAIMTRSVDGLKIGEEVEIGYVDCEIYFIMNKKVGLTVPHDAIKEKVGL